MPADHKAFGSIEALFQQLRDGAVTARTLAETAIAAQTVLEPTLNAYRDWDKNYTRAQAEAADAALAARYDMGVLHGLPVSAKDLYVVNGYETFAGTAKALPMYTAQGPVVRAVRGQMAVIPGKTHTVEWAFGGIGMNPHHATPRNHRRHENVVRALVAGGHRAAVALARHRRRADPHGGGRGAGVWRHRPADRRPAGAAGQVPADRGTALHAWRLRVDV